jgi:hypothetical protein
VCLSFEFAMMLFCIDVLQLTKSETEWQHRRAAIEDERRDPDFADLSREILAPKQGGGGN